jgi:Cdc6-like AAA superfamily ATPase
MNILIKREVKSALETQLAMLQLWLNRTEDGPLKDTLRKRCDITTDAIREIDMTVSVQEHDVLQQLNELMNDLSEMPAAQNKLGKIVDKLESA